MLTWELWFAIVPGLILFLYGIENFSKEIQKVAGERFRSALTKLTKRPLGGALLGALTTSVVQSSTATTVIAVSLVNSGTISFAQSLGIMFGANVGTTITAQLIAFKLTGFAPFLILIGFLLSVFGGKHKFLGKPLFYFGLVFFSLALISQAIEPIKDSPEITLIFSQLSNVFLALLAGILITVILQSSSVTTGIVVLLAGTGLLTLGQSIPIILGANIGTTATSILASYRMDLFARRASVAHFLFNMGGVLIFLPLLVPFASLVGDLGGNAAQQVANAHLIFNLTAAIVFLLILEPFRKLIVRIVPGEEEEILFHTKYLQNGIPASSSRGFNLIEKEILNALDITLKLFDQSLEFIKTGKSQSLQRVAKFENLNDFIDEKIGDALQELSRRKLSKNAAERAILLVRTSNAIEQLGDRAQNLAYLSAEMGDSGLSFSPEAIIEIEVLYKKFRENMQISYELLPRIPPSYAKTMRKNDAAFRVLINSSYKNHLKRLYSQKAYAGATFIEAISVLEHANLHVRELRKLSDLYYNLNHHTKKNR